MNVQLCMKSMFSFLKNYFKNGLPKCLYIFRQSGWETSFFSAIVAIYLTLEQGLANFVSFRKLLSLVRCVYFLSHKDVMFIRRKLTHNTCKDLLICCSSFLRLYLSKISVWIRRLWRLFWDLFNTWFVVTIVQAYEFVVVYYNCVIPLKHMNHSLCYTEGWK